MQKENRNNTKGNKNKRIIFKIVAVLLPFALLLMAEVTLRIFGFGYNLDLFIEDENNKENLVMNSHASKRYFSEEENATIGAFEPFRKIKSKETFRIFILGESTTLGYPFMYNTSFHKWLHFRLMHTFPNRDFEIINLSLTAVNSHTVLGFAKELIKHQPDAVMIYCGQNEYYGALGVGSSSQLGNNRFLIKSILYLRSFRVPQLIGNSYLQIKLKLTGKKVDTRETLMKRMAAKREIPFNSSLFTDGVQQFKTNMEAVCKILTGEDIPVFVSNLVSNEKDLKPFISSGSDSLSSADYYYKLAWNAYDKGDFIEAKKHFIKAKDLDLLRFRAPEAFNEVIAALPDKFSSVYLVDTKKIFEAYSPHGIIGNETILEHVHPSILGYGLMSEAFYQSLKQHHVLSENWANEMLFDELRREMPITEVDSLKGTYEIQLLKQTWPFNQKNVFDANNLNSFEAKLALELLKYKTSWNEAMQKQMSFYLNRNDRVNATRIAEAAALQYPNDVTFLRYAGKFCMGLNENNKAMVYYLHAFRLSADFETAQALVFLSLEEDRPDEALYFLNFLKNQNHSKVNYSIVQSYVIDVIDCKNKLKKDSFNVDLLNQIALNYYKMKNNPVALKYLQRSYEIDESNRTTITLLSKIRNDLKNAQSKRKNHE